MNMTNWQMLGSIYNSAFFLLKSYNWRIFFFAFNGSVIHRSIFLSRLPGDIRLLSEMQYN